MALLMTETLYNGKTISYHRIVAVIVNLSDKTGMATLHSFRDFEHRCSRELPDIKRDFPFPVMSENPISDAYTAIHQLKDWASATNV